LLVYLISSGAFHPILKFFNATHYALHGEGLAGAWKGEFDGDGAADLELGRNKSGDAGFAGVARTVRTLPGDVVGYGENFQLSVNPALRGTARTCPGGGTCFVVEDAFRTHTWMSFLCPHQWVTNSSSKSCGAPSSLSMARGKG